MESGTVPFQVDSPQFMVHIPDAPRPLHRPPNDPLPPEFQAEEFMFVPSRYNDPLEMLLDVINEEEQPSALPSAHLKNRGPRI